MREGKEGTLFCLLTDPNAPASASRQPPRPVAQGCLSVGSLELRAVEEGS